MKSCTLVHSSLFTLHSSLFKGVPEVFGKVHRTVVSKHYPLLLQKCSLESSGYMWDPVCRAASSGIDDPVPGDAFRTGVKCPSDGPCRERFCQMRDLAVGHDTPRRNLPYPFIDSLPSAFSIRHYQRKSQENYFLVNEYEDFSGDPRNR